jgi:uncharacterized protein (DUF2267 family)
MTFSDLITTLMKQSAFVDVSDAELALTTALETLGFVLPARLVRELEATLPERCGWPLAFGRSVSEHHKSTAAKPRELAGRTAERVQQVCAVLAQVLPVALVADISRELPPQLRGALERRPAFTPPPARGLPGTIAGGRPGSMHPISEARPGSRHPLSTGSAAPATSLAAANPHGETKLSSAQGTTQEREHETIAAAYRGH